MRIVPSLFSAMIVPKTCEPRNIIDLVWMEQGLHREPEKLRLEVGREVADSADEHGELYDAILICYGLCSNGVVDIEAKNVPLIIPRAHDCVTLLLGSKEKYREYFDAHRGVYWYSAGWIERSQMPGKERYESTLASYREKYGDDNAEYLMKVEEDWISEYSYATYVDWGALLGDELGEKYRKYTKECADFLGWEYDEIKGDSSLMRRFLDGEWDSDSFLRVEPGERIEADVNNPSILKAVKSG